MSPEEAQDLIARDPRNMEVLFPYLNGQDLNSSPTQQASRWVINFFDWPEDEGEAYRECYRIVEETVKPERQRLNDRGQFKLRKPLPRDGGSMRTRGLLCTAQTCTLDRGPCHYPSLEHVLQVRLFELDKSSQNRLVIFALR